MTQNPQEIGAAHARHGDGVALLVRRGDSVLAGDGGLEVAGVCALDERGRGAADARRMCALRLLLERTGEVPGLEDGSLAAAVVERVCEDGAALDEALRELTGDDTALEAALGALEPLARGARPHGGERLGTVEVFGIESRYDAGIGGWPRARDPLDAWRRGDSRLAPPVVSALHAVAGESPPVVLDGLFEEIAGLRWMPLRTKTLPPATHTNCFVLGESELTVVDPGSDEREEQRRLRAALDGLCARGARVVRVVLTHHHGDHVSGLESVLEAWPLAEVWVQRGMESRRGWPGSVRLVDDGECFGESEAQRYELVHTPGHTSEHVALWHPRSGALICADLMAAVGTIVVSPPEGNMAAYFASLRRVSALSPTVVYPSHGPPIGDAAEHIASYLAHRQQREDQVVGALAAAAQPVRALELVAAIYAAVPRALWPLAERNVVAHLEKLHEEGRAARDGERWWLRES